MTMRSIKLNIELSGNKIGDVIEVENYVARHFLAKGWASEPEEKPKKVKK